MTVLPTPPSLVFLLLPAILEHAGEDEETDGDKLARVMDSLVSWVTPGLV